MTMLSLEAGKVDVTQGGQIIPGPASPLQRDSWRQAAEAWRTGQRGQINHDDTVADLPAYAWCRTSFVQTQMMVEDRYFYDPALGRYTVDRFLDDLVARYGGIDSVLVWPVYPNVGIDNRNQHQLLADLPGGLAGVRGMVADFHRRGVRVLFPIMPWEAGTAQDPLLLPQAMARDFAEAGIDGANGDTMDGFGREFLEAVRASGHPLALEPETGVRSQDLLAWNVMSWGYWDYGQVPPVDRYKWLEPRHLTHVCERWAKDHTAGLQAAFFNGAGFESWENIWGIWNGITPRDAEALRRVATIERALGDRLSSADWQPHVDTLPPDVYASRFPGRDDCAWLLVSRAGHESNRAQLTVPDLAGTSYYDLWHGCRLTPELKDGQATLSFAIEPQGFGAVYATREQTLAPEISTALARMATLSSKALSSFSPDWKPLPQTLVDIPRTLPATTTPAGMTLIPAARYHFKVAGVELEGWGYPPQGDQTGVDFQYPWETVPTRNHEHDLDIAAFYLDTYPVTNAQFKVFLDATGYHPRDDHNFLKDWSAGAFPPGWDRRPVTWVSLDDARAYAHWAGKRLPHEWEWQYAAQGTDGRAYPWGNVVDPSAVPIPATSHDLTGASDVGSHPRGASPFGVMDLVGNVWQWTDEYQDEHTRAAVVRGDSYYHPQGSGWYFPRNPTLAVHGKYLLMCPGKDRAGTLGFRCAQDK